MEIGFARLQNPFTAIFGVSGNLKLSARRGVLNTQGGGVYALVFTAAWG